MQNKNQKSQVGHEVDLVFPKTTQTKRKHERRKIARSEDLFFQFVVGLNITAWMLLVVSLVVFHYARPEFISGVQTYWGIEGRDFWSQAYLQRLLALLQACLGLSLIAFLLRARRNRRHSDPLAVNLLVLAGISLVSLFTLYIVL
ncbi:hypothetical protein ACFO4O_01960 [Glaciecola siphonariae]|uniref:DUF1648 domain-containing protein n=1 Tax=Glaciecola siphonariae TaxID=521012 RepID=A0ABV9LRT3_9ALTE